MKNKAIIAVIAGVLFIILFLRPRYLNDGGTVEYRALLYKISKVSRLISREEMDNLREIV